MNRLEEIGHLHMEANRATRAYKEAVITACTQETGGFLACVESDLRPVCPPCALRFRLNREEAEAWAADLVATSDAVDDQDEIDRAKAAVCLAELALSRAREKAASP